MGFGGLPGLSWSTGFRVHVRARKCHRTGYTRVREVHRPADLAVGDDHALRSQARRVDSGKLATVERNHPAVRAAKPKRLGQCATVEVKALRQLGL